MTIYVSSFTLGILSIFTLIGFIAVAFIIVSIWDQADEL